MVRKIAPKEGKASKNRMSKKQYAAYRGVTVRAVQKAVADGRIAGAVLKDGSLDAALADRLWLDNTDPGRGTPSHIGPLTDAERQVLETATHRRNAGDVLTPRLARILLMNCRAKLAQLELEGRLARLVDIKDVSRERTMLAQATCEAMLAIPDQLAAEIAGMTDPFEVHARMAAQIRSAIVGLTEKVMGVREKQIATLKEAQL